MGDTVVFPFTTQSRWQLEHVRHIIQHQPLLSPLDRTMTKAMQYFNGLPWRSGSVVRYPPTVPDEARIALGSVEPTPVAAHAVSSSAQTLPVAQASVDSSTRPDRKSTRLNSSP